MSSQCVYVPLHSLVGMACSLYGKKEAWDPANSLLLGFHAKVAALGSEAFEVGKVGAVEQGTGCC